MQCCERCVACDFCCCKGQTESSELCEILRQTAAQGLPVTKSSGASVRELHKYSAYSIMPTTDSKESGMLSETPVWELSFYLAAKYDGRIQQPFSNLCFLPYDTCISRVLQVLNCVLTFLVPAWLLAMQRSWFYPSENKGLFFLIHSWVVLILCTKSMAVTAASRPK